MSRKVLLSLLGTVAIMSMDQSMAATTIGGMATSVTKNFTAIGEMLIGLAYVAGIGFGISAIFKFKAHKDNPSQVPIGTPFALLGISVLLVFLPGLYAPAGKTIFGKDPTIGGASGTGMGQLGTV